MKAIQLLQFLLFLVYGADAFYYYSTTGEKKCFQKELSKGTLLKGVYNVEFYDEKTKSYYKPNANDITVMIDVVEIFDDNHRVVHQKGAPQSEFTFIALDSGEHNICLQTQVKSWSSKPSVKVDINFEVGYESDLDSKSSSKVKVLHQKVNQLVAHVESIRREQRLMRDREAAFRDLSEIVNSRATWWAMITVIVLCITGAWQMKHLGSFFVKQKVL
ncbi:Erp1p [Nakaseomyces bracarensis]|uniref:Erp1p n=1 Tax=Nakaseomyces bracarensis TaxID=273131 RepID=UPI003871153B